MSSTAALIRSNNDTGALAPQGPPQVLGPARALAPKYQESREDIESSTVDDNSASEPQPPVPFILLLMLVGAGVLAVLPIVGACNFQNHRFLLLAGAALILPFLVFEAVFLCGGRAWLLAQFFAGDYSEGATARQLPCFWYPEKVQILQYTTGENTGNNIETYATWETNAIVEYVETVRGGNRDGGRVVRDKVQNQGLQEGCSVQIRGLKKTPEYNGMRGTCQEWLARQGRWRVVLHDLQTKDVKPENLDVINSGNYKFKITIPASFGTDLEVSIDSNSKGKLMGSRLPFEAEFDGSAIVAKSGRRQGQAWYKAGYWRLDLVTKVIIAMAVVGLESIFVATVLPPGVVSEGSSRLPLKAVYLVDGSTSITAPQWQAALKANEKFISSFEDVYSSDQGKLNFGFVQFASTANVMLPITNDLSMVTTVLNNMQQLQGDTYYDLALRLCQQVLDDYTKAGPETFDVCVLITDGMDESTKSAETLKSFVAKDTAVFGIFVGNDPQASASLHQIVGCGKIESEGKQNCDFFASAMDFEGLAQKTREIAEAVTRGSDMVLCATRSAYIEGPFLICLILPYLLWYLSCCTVTIAKRRLDNYRKHGSYNLLMVHDRA